MRMDIRLSVPIRWLPSVKPTLTRSPSMSIDLISPASYPLIRTLSPGAAPAESEKCA